MKVLYVTPLVLLCFLTTAVAQFSDIAWVRGGHSEAVLSHAVSPDGRLLVSGSADRTIKLWDIATANLLATLHGHRDAVTSVAFSPDGKSIISGSMDSTVRFWDVESQKQMWVGDNGNSVLAVVYAPSINRLATRQLDGVWNIRDLKSGALVAPFIAGGGVEAVYAWSPDGSVIATSGEYDDTLKLWDVLTGSLRHAIHIQGRKGVTSLAFSPNGKRVVSGGYADSLNIWDVETGTFQRGLKSLSASWPYDLYFTSSGDTLYAAVSDGLMMLDANNDVNLRYLKLLPQPYLIDDDYRWNHILRVRPFCILPNSRHAVINASDSYGGMISFARPFLELRELESGNVTRTLTGHTSSIIPLAFMTGDSLLISCASEHGEIRQWTPSGEQNYSHNLHGVSFFLNLSPDGEFLSTLSGSAESEFNLYVRDNTGKGRSRFSQKYIGIESSETRSWISPGGRYVCYGISGMTLWDSVMKSSTPNALPVAGYQTHQGMVFSPDARLLAIRWSNEVLLWNVAAANIERTFSAVAPVTVAFSRDGRFLAAGSSGGGVTIWEIATGSVVRELSGHRGTVTALAFAGESRYIVSAGADSTVRTWIIETGENDYTYDEYPSAQFSVAVTADGQHIASGAEDGSLIMWQARGAIASVESAHVIAGSSTLRCYPTPSNSLVTIECELARPGAVDVRIVDQLGREVERLADGELQPGTHHFEWNAEALPAGIYHCRLQAGSEHIVRQIVVVR